jgi:transmembrane sensor
MDTNDIRLQYLFRRFLDDTGTAEELQEFWQYMSVLKNDSLVEKELDLLWQASASGQEQEPAGSRDTLLHRIHQKADEWAIQQRPVVFRMRHITRWAVAASVILMLGTGSYFLFFNKAARQLPVVNNNLPAATNDIAPGRNGAVLTLADGKKIVLDDAADGRISADAVKKEDQVSYVDAESTAVTYNTLNTPRGRQFSLELADGSRVWLNAASSITYPTAFPGGERRVEITGEAYFEVAKDPGRPFHVTVNGMDVQVLGTHFNINSYSDEAVTKTTLIEGSVKITGNNSSVLLRPGQQGLSTGSSLKVITEIDIDEVMAWKNGYFSFKGADIATIMRQVARWYDVDVVFEGKIPSRHYRGRASRNLNASQMLKVLEESGIRFRIRDRQIIVTE